MTTEREGQAASGANVGSVVLAGLFGLAVGVVAGLLLAPKAGKHMRDELKGRFDELKAKASDVQAAVGEKIEELRPRSSTCCEEAAEVPGEEDA